MSVTDSPVRGASPWRLLLAFSLMAAGLSAADAPAPHLSSPVAQLDARQADKFSKGEAEFNQRWVVPFHVGGNWGRGPLSNGEACSDCHAGNGRGRAPDHPGATMQSMLVRLSIPGIEPGGAPQPDPVYGSQLQSMGVLGKVPEEAQPRVRYGEHTVTLADGDTVTLRKPEIILRALRYGPLAPDVMLSARVAQPVRGMGLLEAVPDAALLAIAADQQRVGLNGRPNYVLDVERQRRTIGRFGHKANQPTLRQQVASALVEDIGVTSRDFPVENCTPAQQACASVPSVGTLEISDSRFDDLLFYLRALSPPERPNVAGEQVARGERLFAQARCAECHVPELKTGEASLPMLAQQTVRAYTDLLLHDMGEGLSDGRPDFAAGPRDWRTPPLWGLGSQAGNDTYLHDGRARNLTEAILWHAGEAQPSRDAYVALRRQEREALLAFLKSL